MPAAYPAEASYQRSDVVLAGIVTACVYCLAHFQGFFEHYLINDDVRQQIYWMRRFIDPTLYTGDMLTEYARHYVPPGVKAVYRAAALFMDPVDFTKIVSGILYTGLGTAIFLLGRRLAGRSAGFVCLAVFFSIPFFLHNLSGGLSRSFAWPLLGFFLYFRLQGNALGMSLALLFQALFIPYIFLVCAGTCGLDFVLGLHPRVPAAPFPRKLLHFGVLALCLGIILWWRADYHSAGFGPLVSFADMLNRPEFTEQGRFFMLPGPGFLRECIIAPAEGILYMRNGLPALNILLFASMVITAGIGIFRRKDLPGRLLCREVLVLLAASLILYIAARIFLLKLFVPSRYISYTLLLLYCLGFGLSIFIFLARSKPRTIYLVLFLAAGLGALRMHNAGLYDYTSDRALCETLQAQSSKDSLIAGPLHLMDTVLTFSRRKVLASYELAHPWSKGLWAELEPRIQDMYDVYYTEDINDLRRFRERYGVDYFIIDQRHYETEYLNNPALFAPLDAYIRQRAQAAEAFALPHQTVYPLLVPDEHRIVIDIRSPI